MGAYVVPDLPTRGAEAFLPAPPPVATAFGVSSWGLVQVTGAPGSAVMPSPNPPTTNNVHPSAELRTQPGNVAPGEVARAPLPMIWQAWKPSVYVAGTANMGPQRGGLGIAVRHHEDMPVPALKIQPVALSVQRTPPMTYGRVTPSPRVFPRFRSVLEPLG